jgi:hypothetical protein
MKLQRRKNWKDDQGISSAILEILTCISCPDSKGFKFENDEIILDKPLCAWHGEGKETPLSDFPIIPPWCPKLDDWEPDLITSADNPEKFAHKKLCWERLSKESKIVLGILFNTPDEFLKKQKQIIKSIISQTVVDIYPWNIRGIKKNKIYNELKDFTNQLM